MIQSESKLCFYCLEYGKIANDYPQNLASKDKESLTPRCYLHWKYECNNCGKMTHFNGIAWCSDCGIFTCVNCSEEKLVRKNFLIYDYYYTIPCKKCGKLNPSLDYAEYNGVHPFQTGEIIPNEEILVWMPIYKEKAVSKTYPHPAWGSERVEKLGKYIEITRLNSMKSISLKFIWDKNAPEWGGKWPEGGDFNHKYIIIPEVIRLLDIKKGEKILDVACGEGTISRMLIEKEAEVTSIDFSNMIDYAIEKEKKEKLGIKYIKGNALNLTEYFNREFFDKVVCNMAVMDIVDHEKLFQEIFKILKDEGEFVFSITHPCFALPATISIKVPTDSQRNEDRIRIMKNYFEKRPTLVKWDPLPQPMLYFPRTISEYVNSLQAENLQIIEMSEPQASQELIEKFPRNTYRDMDITAYFLIIKTKKHIK
jgi:ubiquinone/menaquinone biosynthesis C-methylase UbiE